MNQEELKETESVVPANQAGPGIAGLANPPGLTQPQKKKKRLRDILRRDEK